MSRKQARQPKPGSSSVGQHPRIQELDNLQDFKNFIGNAEIPDVPLVEKIAELQAQRDAKLNASSSSASGSSASPQSVPKRYRKPPSQAGTVASLGEIDRDEDLTRLGRFMFDALDYATYLIPIISVHVVLDILVRVQYSEDTFEGFAQRAIVARAATAVPVFALLHHFVHPLRNTRLFKIASFLASVAAGGYLLYASNEEGYYYVMKRAPPLGTLWVWMFVEMEWQWAALSLVVIVFWMWLKDYSI